MSALKKTILVLGLILAIVIIVLAVAIYKKNHTPEVAAPSQPVTEQHAEQPPSPAIPTVKTYDNHDSRYSIQYPADWSYDASSEGTVVFSGKEGTSSFYSTVNIQTILTKKMGGDYANVKQFITDIKKQAAHQSKQVKFLEAGPLTIPQADGSKAKGEYLTFTYHYKDIEFKQWQI